MQRTGLMHVGWWEGALSVLANIKAGYAIEGLASRVSPAREANLLMGVGCQTYWVTSELKNCFILQSVYLEVCIENEPVKKHRFVEAWSVDSNGECTPNQGLDSFLISSNSYDTAGSMAILAKAWHIPKRGRTYADMAHS